MTSSVTIVPRGRISGRPLRLGPVEKGLTSVDGAFPLLARLLVTDEDAIV